MGSAVRKYQVHSSQKPAKPSQVDHKIRPWPHGAFPLLLSHVSLAPDSPLNTAQSQLAGRDTALKNLVLSGALSTS